jgi:tetratricopeptide (TPR) repeat protein
MSPGRARSILIFLLSAALALPARADSWAKEIEALIAAGKVPEARVKFSEQAAPVRQSYAGLVVEARLLAAENRFRESMTVLARCLAARRDDPEVYKLVATAAIRLDKLQTAEMALKSAETLAPEDYLVQFNLGALYYTQSRFPYARPHLERAVALRPGYIPAQLFLGLTQEELAGEAAAIQTYRRAIALNEAQGGRSELPYLYLGRLLYRLDRFQDALPLLRKASAANAGSAEAWLLLGKTCNSIGQADEAVAALRHAVEADPRDPEPHYVLSRIFLAQHKNEQSADELARFHELDKPAARKDDGRRRKPTLP